jgi:alkylation response protein AidB-like acyl-CoA dehydrogenase
MIEPFYGQDHESFRTVVREFVHREVAPHLDEWESERFVPREVWKRAGAQGVLGVLIPEEYGGASSDDYRFRCVVHEELSRVGAAALASGFSINEDVVVGYLRAFGSQEQQRAWLPSMASGTAVASIAMSEPVAGSDLRAMRTSARRSNEGWVIDGTKTFITSGFSSDVVIVAARTGEQAGRPQLSLFVVPTDTPGYTRGRKLPKLGLHAQDTAEIAFTEMELPATSLLGERGRGFHHLTQQLPLERLSIAWRALAAAEAAVEWTVNYTRNRTAFGQRIIDFQNTRFRLAELVTELDVTRAYLERATHQFHEGGLGAVDGAKAKWWATELQKRVVDSCLQMHGGYGYMDEYPISRAYADARVQTLVGGTTEIMKEIIGRHIAGPVGGSARQ